MTDEEARTAPVTLDFLDEGRTYTAEIYRDGYGADYRPAARHNIAIEKRRVRKGDRLEIRTVKDCSQQSWPNFEASCLRTAGSQSSVKEVRLVTADRTP